MPKTRRTLEERLADNQQIGEDIKDKIRLRDINAAVKEGKISEGNEPLFKLLKRELTSVKKAVKAAARHEREGLVQALEEFTSDIAESMASLVQPGDD